MCFQLKCPDFPSKMSGILDPRIPPFRSSALKANMEDRSFGRFSDITENDAAINFTHDRHNADVCLEEQSGAINDPWTQSNLGYMEQWEIIRETFRPQYQQGRT